MKKTQTNTEKVEKKETKKSVIKKTVKKEEKPAKKSIIKKAIKKEDKPVKKVVKKKTTKKDTKLAEKKEQEKQNQLIIDKILNEDENYDIEKLHNSDTYKKSIEIERNLGNVPIVEIPKDINLPEEKTTVDPQIEVEPVSKEEVIKKEEQKPVQEETVIEERPEIEEEIVEEVIEDNETEEQPKEEEIIEEEKPEIEEPAVGDVVEEIVVEQPKIEKEEPKEKLNLEEVLNKELNLEEEPVKDITNILQQKIEEKREQKTRNEKEESEIADIFNDKRIDISDLNINADNLRYKSIESNTNYLGKVKDPKKRNMIIITVLLITAILGSIGTFTYIQYNKKLKEQNEIKKQETTLKNELNKIIDTNLLSDSINMEIKSKGDYAYLEKEIKKYYQELIDNLQTIISITQDEDFNKISTIESIKKDDSELNNSYAIINRTKPKYKEAIDNLKEICTKEKIAKILNKKMDKYYNNLYEELMYSDEEIEKLNNYQDYLKEIDEHETVVIEKTEELVKFLKEQKGNWNIEGKELKSSSDFVQSKYKQINEQLEEEIEKIKLINIQYGYKKRKN